MTWIDIALEFIGLLAITVLGIIGLLTATDKFARYMVLRDEKRKLKEEKMRLIDLDSLPEGRLTWEDIDNATVIEVVQCINCKWWTKQKASAQGRCALSGGYPTGGWYCANGRRKDDDTD